MSLLFDTSYPAMSDIAPGPPRARWELTAPVRNPPVPGPPYPNPKTQEAWARPPGCQAAWQSRPRGSPSCLWARRPTAHPARISYFLGIPGKCHGEHCFFSSYFSHFRHMLVIFVFIFVHVFFICFGDPWAWPPGCLAAWLPGRLAGLRASPDLFSLTLRCVFEENRSAGLSRPIFVNFTRCF